MTCAFVSHMAVKEKGLVAGGRGGRAGGAGAAAGGGRRRAAPAAALRRTVHRHGAAGAACRAGVRPPAQPPSLTHRNCVNTIKGTLHTANTGISGCCAPAGVRGTAQCCLRLPSVETAWRGCISWVAQAWLRRCPACLCSFVEDMLAYLSGLVSPGELLPAARQARAPPPLPGSTHTRGLEWAWSELGVAQ